LFSELSLIPCSSYYSPCISSILHVYSLFFTFAFVNYTVIYKTKVERKDIELVEEEEAQIGADRSSATSNKSEIYKEEARNAAQKHKPKRVESVNADAEAFGDHWKIQIALCILKLKH